MTAPISLTDMIDIVTLTGHAEEFKDKCLVLGEDGAVPSWNARKALDFLIEHNLPTTPEEYQAATRYAFNTMHPKNLKLAKGDYVILSADGILNTTAFVHDTGTDIIIVKALEGFEFDTSKCLCTSGPTRSLVDALQPYIDNYLIEIITNVKALVFSTSKRILQKDGEE